MFWYELHCSKEEGRPDRINGRGKERWMRRNAKVSKGYSVGGNMSKSIPGLHRAQDVLVMFCSLPHHDALPQHTATEPQHYNTPTVSTALLTPAVQAFLARIKAACKEGPET
ncbi:hypothetical protein E2C01_056568 [Portunus trituberculatus]|uniref:Uncharacterized protein n=1 Tax=Portunus trituberculatus TaxID=210409 RepID=A0A5B7GXT2_PORTR|nr:hypothetical protein [Portunus trituberculatus]